MLKGFGADPIHLALVLFNFVVLSYCLILFICSHTSEIVLRVYSKITFGKVEIFQMETVIIHTERHGQMCSYIYIYIYIYELYVHHICVYMFIC